MTSTLRRPASTASLQPQQTQNTAPIIEHRCLYTHDLRRKAKRWQDGILRFHTFNKRVMVYDVPRNYIGDTHWREGYPVQDGDEFELDRPILVQVGEQVGSVDQDLTALLGRRNKKDAVPESRPESYSSSPPVPLIANGSRVAAAMPTQLKPKSLNALLGTPKGRIGRASLPADSPYELRRIESAGGIVEPHAKRQRVEMHTGPKQPTNENRCRFKNSFEKRAGKENTRPIGESHCAGALEHERSDKYNQPFPRHEKTLLPTAGSTEITTPIRHREPMQADFGRPSRNDHENETFQAPVAATADEQEQARPTEFITREKTFVTEVEPTKVLAHSALLEPLEIIDLLPGTGTDMSHSNEPTRPKTRLQMASRKPRRKLMYKDLLPQDVPSLGTTSTDVISNRKSSGRDYMSKAQTNGSSDPSSMAHLVEQEGSETRLPKHHTRNRHRSERILPLSPESPSWELDKPGIGGTRGLDRSKHESERRQHAKHILNRPRSSSIEAVEPSIPKAVSLTHDTNLALAVMDDILLSHSQTQRSTRQNGPRSIDSGSTTKRLEPSLMEPSAAPSAQGLSETLKEFPLHSSPITQVPSSQLFDTQVDHLSNGRLPCATIRNEDGLKIHPIVVSTDKSPSNSPAFVSALTRASAIDDLSASKPSQMSGASHTTSTAAKSNVMPASPLVAHSPEDWSAPCETHVAALPAARLFETSPVRDDVPSIPGRAPLHDPQTTKAATGLPHFKPLRSTTSRQRSAIKKSVLDTPHTAIARPTSDMGNSGAKNSNLNGSEEQSTSPWSIEAWDLFGCGRDGVSVDFGTFRMHQGV